MSEFTQHVYSGYNRKHYYAKGLLFWALTDIETFKFVLSLVKDHTQLQLETYSTFFDPIWGAIHEQEMGLIKLEYLIPFTTKKFWNSGRWIASCEVDHTPLADAIMIGNIGMVKVWISLFLYTKLIQGDRNLNFLMFCKIDFQRALLSLHVLT